MMMNPKKNKTVRIIVGVIAIFLVAAMVLAPILSNLG